MTTVTEAIKSRFFKGPGAYVLVDGQYGSTGKGLLASAMTDAAMDRNVRHVTTNAGPNSGHTAYFKGEKVMTQQIPIMSKMMAAKGYHHVCYLNAGAVIDPAILRREADLPYSVVASLRISDYAAIIEEADKAPVASLAKIASTGKGVGQAMARKVLREGNIAKSSGEFMKEIHRTNCFLVPNEPYDSAVDKIFVETAQGFSLGINSGFYPHTTSRECTVAQALADARIPPTDFAGSVLCLRTYPIRVGNTPEGFSGPVYGDQQETSWEVLGLPPEHTTITNRVRRVFTWSRQQFVAAVKANRPNILFLNFCNYLKPEEIRPFVGQMLADYRSAMPSNPEPLVLLGFGPLDSDIKVFDANFRTA